MLLQSGTLNVTMSRGGQLLQIRLLDPTILVHTRMSQNAGTPLDTCRTMSTTCQNNSALFTDAKAGSYI